MEYPKIETLFERDPVTFKVLPDQLRRPEFSFIKSWHFTEKIDGTNIRLGWDPKTGKLRFGGKTETAQIPTRLLDKLQDTVSLEKLNIVFPDAPATVYGEGYGPGIQKGGGDYAYEPSFIVFDVLVDNKWWLDMDDVTDVASKLSLKTVPYLGLMSLEDAVDLTRTGFASLLAAEQTGKTRQAEGMVGRTSVPLFNKQGERLIIKIKTKDFS